jgi:hypothetical protein
MNKPKFSIQTLLVVLTLVAVALVGYQQYRLHEKLERLEFLENNTGVQRTISRLSESLDLDNEDHRRAQTNLMHLSEYFCSRPIEYAVSSDGSSSVHLFWNSTPSEHETRVAIFERGGEIIDVLSCRARYEKWIRLPSSTFWDARSSHIACGDDLCLRDLNGDGFAEITYRVRDRECAYRATEKGFVIIDPKTLEESEIHANLEWVEPGSTNDSDEE